MFLYENKSVDLI